MTTTVIEASPERPSEVVTRLLVTARDPQSHRYRPVGFLSHDDDLYRFAYLRREVQRVDFRPLPGLARAVAAQMEAPALFPLFAERVISARRPDRESTLDALGLTSDAAPFEVLVRSHGQRVGDTIELLPAPLVAPGATVAFTFLSHGVRYLSAASQERITDLSHGDPLRLCVDTENPVNPKALLVTDLDELALGWVPDPLVSVIEVLQERRISVERSNGPEVGYHFRLLANVEGTLPPGDQMFAGPDWAIVA